jgi:hypothetical protein
VKPKSGSLKGETGAAADAFSAEGAGGACAAVATAAPDVRNKRRLIKKDLSS